MIRTIIQLTETQAEQLRAVAKEKGVSKSEIIRQSLSMMLPGMTDAEVRRRAREAVGFATSGDTDVSVRHDDYLAEAYRQ